MLRRFAQGEPTRLRLAMTPPAQLGWWCLVLLLACAGPALAQGYALVEVRAGEALGSIAQRYRTGVEALLEANGRQSPRIWPGELLRVPLQDAQGGLLEAAPVPPPGFRRHTLAPAETLSALTQRYRVTLNALVGANPDLFSLDRLPVGVELLIPPGEGLLVTLDVGLTLTELIAHHRADPLAVARANGLRGPFDIRLGMLLFLPGVEPTAAPTGTTIVAARTGTVTFAGWLTQGYGNLVKIRHAEGHETWYAHASRLLVVVGQRVGQGEAIARVGSTGISTGPHLHLEIHVDGRAVDPLRELR